MLERIPTVPTAQELLDSAFQRSLKLEIYDPVRYHRIRKTETARMISVCDKIAERLLKQHRSWPNLEGLRDYQQELIDIIVGVPQLKKSLGSLEWTGRKIREVRADAQQRMARARDVETVKKVQNSCYGRVSDLVNSLDKDLAILAATRDQIRKLPTVSPDYATVVLAGFPNVGKSTLLSEWTRASPEIADYAFTTKSSNVGHFEIVDQQDVATRYQVVDTPGLLDRPAEKRNNIEKQATAALKHVADAVVFLIDPNSHLYTIEEQESLLASIQRDMAGLPFLVVESKLDQGASGSGRLAFSTHTREGLDDLRREVLRMLHFEDDLELENDPLLKWVKPDVEEDEWGDFL